jgi:hypothetical protein
MEEYENENPAWSADQATNASVKEIEDFIQARIREYKEEDMNGNKLFKMWKEDFTNFTTVIFDKAREATKTLQDFLHANGVYIPKSRRLVASELFRMLQRYEPEIWPINEKDQPSWLKVQTDRPSTQPLTQQSTQLPDQETQGRLQNSQHSIATLLKMYTDEQKYSGDLDNFKFKYTIFLNLCKRAEVPKDAYLKAFPTMLKGAALNYYYMNCKLESSLPDLCNNIKQHFEGAAYE